MIKKESGILTYMSKGFNGLVRDDSVAGMHLAQRMDEKIAEKLKNKSDRNLEDDMER